MPFLTLAGTAQAQGKGAAEAAFEAFAGGWMQGLERESEEQSDQARFLRPVGDGPGTVKVRRYGEDFTTTLKPTGNAVAPFVGILSYTEDTYVCTNEGELDCKLVESSPVTEIFPYKEGRWQY